MGKLFLLVLLLLPLGCARDHANTQNPVQLAYGTATQSNANMNYQPSIVIGNQPLGKEILIATVNTDIQDHLANLSILEAAIQRELGLPEEQHLVAFPVPLNTSQFAALRVAYPKEFLELDEGTRASYVAFYRKLDMINGNLNQRSSLTVTALSNAGRSMKIYDQIIFSDIQEARKAVANLNLKRQ